MGKNYHRGHKLDVWLSDAAWLLLNQRGEKTLRAKVEGALVEARTPVVIETELDRRSVLAWMRANQDEEDLRATFSGMKKWAARSGVQLS